ncbi:MAG TPA: peptidase [Chroococcidiopsis sp.]
MSRNFRRYHRALGIIACLPLVLIVLSGLGYTILDEWLDVEGMGSLMLKIHTLDFLGLGKIYPVVAGLGLVGLLVTGMDLTGLFRRKRSASGNS